RLDTPADVQVGMAMHACLIRAAIEDGRREYDFLAGVSQYKTSVALASRPIVRLRVARPSMREWARAGLARVASSVRIARDRGRGLLSR
ncbi:MAG: GNAT family N-acetyltransferase, partial [Gammaproteobacteria bacterium]